MTWVWEEGGKAGIVEAGTWHEAREKASVKDEDPMRSGLRVTRAPNGKGKGRGWKRRR